MFYRIVITLILIFTFGINCESGESKKTKSNIKTNDKKIIFNIVENYIKSIVYKNEKKTVLKYLSKDVWSTGGEELRITIIDNYKIKDIEISDDEEFGVWINVNIVFNKIAEVDQHKFKKVKKSETGITGFVFEDGKWKIKSPFEEIFLSKTGVEKWIKDNKDKQNKMYKKVIKHLKKNKDNY